MTTSICFNCGAEKAEVLTQCESCNTTPITNNDLALSLALSDHLSSKDQLLHYRHEIQNHLKLTVPDKTLLQAKRILENQKLMKLLGLQLPTPKSVEDTQDISSLITTPVATHDSTDDSLETRYQLCLQKSHLQKSPFVLLGVTTRDNRRRIVEVAEEKSLELDPDACQKARSDLTNPRVRLGAEMAWLSGVSPTRVLQLVATLQSDPMSIREELGLPTLANLNLLAAAFEVVDDNDPSEYVADFIQQMAYLADDLSAEQVLCDINEDRSVSGFPEVRGVDQVEAGLLERKHYYRNAIKDALNRLSPVSLVDTMTGVVDGVTLGGDEHAPELIDELVDSYAVETQTFLQKEAENVEKLIKATRESAKSGEERTKPLVDKLVVVASNWDKVAQPIQLSAKARGTDHEPSFEIANSIRSLAIDLFNEFDMLDQSQALTELIKELFAELPEVVEQADKDAADLAEISQGRK